MSYARAGDSAIWTGHYLAAEALRYAVTRSPDALDNARRALQGIQSLLDVTGTYIAEMRPGATEKHNSPGYRMRTAVIETARGPYFLKMVGPAETVAAWNASVDQFLGSLSFSQ